MWLDEVPQQHHRKRQQRLEETGMGDGDGDGDGGGNGDGMMDIAATRNKRYLHKPIQFVCRKARWKHCCRWASGEG